MQPIESESTRRFEAVRKYFAKTPPPPVYGTATTLAVLAGLSLLPVLADIVISIAQRQFVSCFGCVAVLSLLTAIGLAVPAALSYRKTKSAYDQKYAYAEPKPTDEEIDRWHKLDCDFYEKYALQRLNLTADQIQADNRGKPLVIVGSASGAQVRRGADGVLRFSAHELLIIYLTRYQVAAYKCVIDLHDGLTKSEMTYEYHYRDVVSVSTHRNPSKVVVYVDGQRQDILVNESFTLSVSNGEHISIATDVNESLKLLQGTTNFARTSPQEAVKSIRARLREIKGGAVDTGPLF